MLAKMDEQIHFSSIELDWWFTPARMKTRKQKYEMKIVNSDIHHIE